MLLAARCKYRTQKRRKNCDLGAIAQICRDESSQLKHVSTIGKKLVSSNMSCTCPYNMANFGPLVAEIVSLVWGIPANFNGFRVLAALLHGILVVGVSQTAAFNRGRHLYLAGRPSGWALAHISSYYYFAPACREVKYCDEHVCVSVCLCFHSHISQKPRVQTSLNVLYMFARARGSVL